MIKSPCKDCVDANPPKCRIKCPTLRAFQQTLEEIPQSSGCSMVSGVSRRYPSHE